MHSDIHLQLHALLAAELHAEAAEFRRGIRHRQRGRRPRATLGLRIRLGWSLVELGLRLVNRPVVRRTGTHLA
ncbi:hypothetical protein [Streptomyces corynorhini]|uniref:Uncharacterized protein n=1 Tax=Streptomyces corynorhini TaxID=2282652 RepID=A0A370BBP2_9ACTN|nr:hypothetical protein [Streptomyces corynorhini]RDG37594.1 hypothetical protein DVH02_13855 [Streptomyces corynorhini]